MDPRTIFELFEAVTSTHPDKVAFRYKKEGAWRDVTWSAHRRAVDSISKSLIALGVEKGDAVGVIGSTRLEWVQCDSAIVNIGAVTVGIYHSLVGADCSYIIQHSEAALLFVEDVEQLEKILAFRDEMPALRRIVLFDGPGDESRGVTAWSDFLALGAGVPGTDLERRNRSIAPDDLASLVYTSGTTGLPKGAMISHANLLFTARAAEACLVLEPDYTTLLFLPLAHVFARMIVYLCMQTALTIAFVEDLGKIAENMKEVRPHFIGSVPRIYEKFHEKDRGVCQAKRRIQELAFQLGRSGGRACGVARDAGQASLRHLEAATRRGRQTRPVQGARGVRRAHGLLRFRRGPSQPEELPVLRLVRHPPDGGVRHDREHLLLQCEPHGSHQAWHGRYRRPGNRDEARLRRRGAVPWRQRDVGLLQGPGSNREDDRRGRLAAQRRHRDDR